MALVHFARGPLVSALRRLATVVSIQEPGRTDRQIFSTREPFAALQNHKQVGIFFSEHALHFIPSPRGLDTGRISRARNE